MIQMNENGDMRTLASELRERLFDNLGHDVDLVVSSDTMNKSYLSGYVSILHDLVPSYRCAVLACRKRASLVVSAADAGPAYEFFGNTSDLYRYGTFYFAASPEAPDDFRKDAHASFHGAFTEALQALRPQNGLVGVDRTDDDVLWNLCREALGDEKIVDITSHIAHARAVKTAGEIRRLQKASALVEEGFSWVVENARVGMRECEIAAEIARIIVSGGGQAKFISVSSGPRSALADTYPTIRKILPGDVIRIDAGCTVDGYWSDIARTFVCGEPDKRQRRVYNALHKGLEAEMASVRAGVSANQLFDVAMQAVRSNGLPYYKRQHCGHGIGLKSYDNPTINADDKTLLLEGMCLCLETPYYEIGADGMMVEDMIRVTATGYEPITKISRELFVLST